MLKTKPLPDGNALEEDHSWGLRSLLSGTGVLQPKCTPLLAFLPFLSSFIPPFLRSWNYGPLNFFFFNSSVLPRFKVHQVVLIYSQVWEPLKPKHP